MTCYKYSITCQDDLLTVDNAQSHVTAFRPISEAARSWSDDNIQMMHGSECDMQIRIDSAVTDLRMREKDTVCMDFFINISRVCAVAQYAVLEVNAEVNRRGPFSHPTPPKPLNQFRCHVNILLRPPGS